VHNFTSPSIYVPSFNQFLQVVSEFCSGQKIPRRIIRSGRRIRITTNTICLPLQRRGDIIIAIFDNFKGDNPVVHGFIMMIFERNQALMEI
jgi:hypothetical protein